MSCHNFAFGWLIVFWLIIGLCAFGKEPTFQAIKLKAPFDKIAGIKYQMGETASALPLGALGTGAIDLDSDGAFKNNALQNNPRNKIADLSGDFFAIYTNLKGEKIAKVLQGHSKYNFPTINNLNYIGHYPFADLLYQDKDLPLEISLRAFSPFIPYDYKNSGLPAAIFLFTLKNKTEAPVEASVAFSWQNDIRSPMESYGNLGGWLSSAPQSLNPQESFISTFIHAIGDSYEELKKEIGKAKDWYVGATIGRPANAAVEEFYIDAQGGFSWEKRNLETFWYKGEGHIAQIFFYIHYNDGRPKRAGLQYRAGEDSVAENLIIKKPTKWLKKDEIALTELSTQDGALKIELKTMLGEGKFVVREFKVTNTSQKRLDAVELYYYVNYDVGGPQRCGDNYGKYNFHDDILTIYHPNLSIYAGIATSEPPDKISLSDWNISLSEMINGQGTELKKLRDELRKGLGYANSYRSAGKLKGLFFEAKPKEDSYAIASLADKGLKITYLNAWDFQGNGEDFWTPFSKDGQFASSAETGTTEKPQAGALAAKTKLAPGEEREIIFILTWHFPEFKDSSGKFLGHIYSNWFPNAWETAKYVSENFKYLYEKSAEWQNKIYASSLPDWLKDALINGLYSLARNTMWIKDGRFAHSESFTGCPITETIVCRFNGSFPLIMLFPELEFNTMEQFAGWQTEEGAIPFAFGAPEYFDRPYYETQKSIDSSEFVLMAYRDYVWSGNTDFLVKMYPHVKKAIAYGMTLDTDKDYLINEVSMQYYDCWQFFGTSAYVASIWLAALKAGEKMAEIMQDREFGDACRTWFSKGLQNFEANLWNGEYYNLYNEPETGKKSEVSLSNQLVGQWYAYLTGLGEILPHDHIISALRAINRLNVSNTPFGVASGVRPTGEREPGAHSDCVVIGESFNYAATCMFASEFELGLNAARKTYETVALHQKMPWNVHFNLSASDGKPIWGSDYYSNMCIWSLLPAFSGILADANEKKLTIKPKLKEIDAPLFFPYLKGRLTYKYQQKPGGRNLLEVSIINENVKAVGFQQLSLGIKICRDKVKSISLKSHDGKTTRLTQYRFISPDELLIEQKIELQPGKNSLMVFLY